MQVPVDYKTALNRKYPESVTIATAVDAQGKPNPITLGWAMTTSHEPPMWAISIGKQRYSLEAIRHAGAFVLSFPSSKMVEDAVFHGTKSGRDMDKIQNCGTATQPAKKVPGVLLADAVANLECRLCGEMESGDHVIFVGEVVASHMHEKPGVRRLYTLGNDQMGGVVPG